MVSESHPASTAPREIARAKFLTGSGPSPAFTRWVASARSPLIMSWCWGGRTLRAAVAKVPETNRVVLELFYFGGLDLVAISRMLGRPEGTVKSQLHRAREILRRKLEGRV